MEFKPSVENCGADLISRPHVEKKRVKESNVNGVSVDAQESLWTRMQENDRLGIQKLRGDAKTPRRLTQGAAGYGLSSCECQTVLPWGKALFSTGIALGLPSGKYGRIAPRSRLAMKHSIAVGAGVIDLDYFGEVGVILFNHSNQEFRVAKGDRVAELVLEEIRTPETVELLNIEET